MCAAFTVCAVCSLEEPQRLFLPLLLLEIMNSDLYIQQDRLELLHSVARRLNDCFHCKGETERRVVQKEWVQGGGGRQTTDHGGNKLSRLVLRHHATVFTLPTKSERKKRQQLALCFYANELACARKKECWQELTSEAWCDNLVGRVAFQNNVKFDSPWSTLSQAETKAKQKTTKKHVKIIRRRWDACAGRVVDWCLTQLSILSVYTGDQTRGLITPPLPGGHTRILWAVALHERNEDEASKELVDRYLINR